MIATLWHLCGTPNRCYLWELLQNISLQLCQGLALCGFPHIYFSISCYDEVIFDFYYFIGVPIGKTCSMSLMRFNNRIFCIISMLNLSKFSQCFKVLMLTCETIFELTL